MSSTNSRQPIQSEKPNIVRIPVATPYPPPRDEELVRPLVQAAHHGAVGTVEGVQRRRTTPPRGGVSSSSSDRLDAAKERDEQVEHVVDLLVREG